MEISTRKDVSFTIIHFLKKKELDLQCPCRVRKPAQGAVTYSK